MTLWPDAPPPMWCAWFTGLIDGEGYFQLTQRNTGTRAFQVELIINLREDDILVQEEIRRTLKIGRLYHINESGARAKGERASDQVRWRCTRIADIMRILIPLFDTYQLHSKKRRDFEIWREAATIVYQHKHLLPAGRRRMVELVRDLKIFRHMTPLALSEARSQITHHDEKAGAGMTRPDSISTGHFPPEQLREV